jgi:2-polyprenyl-3-methyl-5-hydroxy-6-metoxy-1,4-benzoquinol methylase
MSRNTGKVRSDCRYNQKEIDEINPFKLDFISSTIQDRMNILKRDILPAMFNYWQDIGKVYNPVQSKALSKVEHKYI